MADVTLVIKLFQQFTGTDVKELAVIEALEHTTTTPVPVPGSSSLLLSFKNGKLRPAELQTVDIL